MKKRNLAFWENHVSNEAPAVLNQITDVILSYKPKQKRQGITDRTSPKQRLIDQIVQWRQQMGGSISVHNHRRLLNTWSTSELQFLWDKIQTGEGSSIWKERGEKP
jgi:hypothetical protein